MDTNTMLREAITTDSRKRKARWQNELESMGYKIIKDGCWIIKNPKTNRRITLDYNGDYLYTNKNNIRFGCIWSYKKGGYVTKPLEKINLERLLNKNNIVETWGYRNSWTNVECMVDALHDRKYHQTELDNAMNEYQKTIDDITKEYQRKLTDAKRNYDWSIEYHTRELETSNKTINKLLKREN